MTEACRPPAVCVDPVVRVLRNRVIDKQVMLDRRAESMLVLDPERAVNGSIALPESCRSTPALAWEMPAFQ